MVYKVDIGVDCRQDSLSVFPVYYISPPSPPHLEDPRDTLPTPFN